MSTAFCSACGQQISAAAPACPKCGHPQASAANVGGRSRIAAALFALFLGGLGIHKFYLGRIGQGVVYLLFFWTFIPAIVAFIESIMYFAMSDAEFNQKYNR